MIPPDQRLGRLHCCGFHAVPALTDQVLVLLSRVARVATLARGALRIILVRSHPAKSTIRPMKNIPLILQVAVVLGILNVWLLRYPNLS